MRNRGGRDVRDRRLPDMNDGSNVGALIIRNGVGGILYYRYDRSRRIGWL